MPETLELDLMLYVVVLSDSIPADFDANDFDSSDFST